MKKSLYALGFRAFVSIFAVAGILIHINVFNSDFTRASLYYYTVQSNIVVAIFFIYMFIRTCISFYKKSYEVSFSANLQFVLLIDILLTFIVFWVLLAPQAHQVDFPLWTFSNLAVHAITPIFMLIDYLWFKDKGNVKKHSVYWTLAFPLVYVLITSMIGLTGFVFSYDELGVPIHYPYFFMDYDRVGALSIVYILILILVFLGISYGFYRLDHQAKHRKSKEFQE